MINVVVRLSHKKHIEDFVEELEYASSSTFIKALNIRGFENQALRQLKKFFPKSSKRGTHLVSGWKSELRVTQSGVGFRLVHVGEKDRRTKKILRILDEGHWTYTYVMRKAVRFWGIYTSGEHAGEEGWVTLAKGRPITQSSREGYEYVDKTKAYIDDVLIPQLRQQIRDKIASRIKRIKK